MVHTVATDSRGMANEYELDQDIEHFSGSSRKIPIVEIVRVLVLCWTLLALRALNP